MPRLKSLLKVTGTMDDLTFYHSRTEGYLVRRTHRHDAEKVKNSPNFERTMENATEFGRVTKVATLLRRLMGNSFKSCGDARMTSRLISTLHKVMKEDKTSTRGQRMVGPGMSELEGKEILLGFDLNKNYPLDQILHAKPVVDLVTGVIRIKTDPNLLQWPPTATHVLFRSVWVRLDTAAMKGDAVRTETDLFERDQLPTDIALNPERSPEGPGQDLLLLQVQFYIQEGPKAYDLNEGRACAVVGV
ncbi:MAG: hypothetical protein K9I85_15410 [Saprospiraceae bacterium]|nr:hypothetical protein [Saprospiraceae bacterium]